MRTPEENLKLAQLLFPDLGETPEDMERRFPGRTLPEDAMVLRFAPSPTGFLHIGGVYMAMIESILAKQSNGVSILRIEDTDKNREVSNGAGIIIKGIKGFGIEFNEGMTSEDSWDGDYGPYIQSSRLNIYAIYAKDLVEKGYAYPCFITSEELEEIRKKQEEMGVRTGYYGQWAKWRNASLEEVKSKLSIGEKFVIRLYSTGNPDNTFHTKDLIKGNLTLRENDMDAVLLKSDGFPTYHFAHPIDDHLMRITHVIRGDEWLPSEPLHKEIFEKLGFKLFPYGHISPLEKLDNGKKRKLSKRKDPEADVLYYIEKGYPKEGVKEYLLNIANSNYYDWRIQNPDKSDNEFTLKLEKFNKAGALFDIVKLDDVCKNYISTLSADEVYSSALEWAEEYDNGIELLLRDNKEYCLKIFNIERGGNKVRKDLVKFEDIKSQLDIFFDELLEPIEDISDRISKEEQKKLLNDYLKIFNIDDNSNEWFEKIKKIAVDNGYCIDRKEYEKDFSKYKGMVGEVAMVVRVAVTHKTKTPDLYQVMQVLGEEVTKDRIGQYLKWL